MKKLFVMAAMVLSSVGAFAQYNAGDVTIQPKVGLNVSSVTEDDAEYKAGFVGGAELEYHVSPMFGISGGLLYSMQGAKVKDSDVKMKMDYHPYSCQRLCSSRSCIKGWYPASI